EALGPAVEGPRPEDQPSSGAPVGVRRREHVPREPSHAPHPRVAEEQPEEQRGGASRQPSPAPPQPTGPQSHAGSALLIVGLTLALATLVFRRIYLAQDYKLDYDL
ncbi:unnamed protein product, partial [Tetraodon nigroviridis]